MADDEDRAEAAYAAMYDAEPRACKDLKDDACFYLSRAIAAAKAAGRHGDAARLRERLDHVTRVYNSQFRGVGR